MTNRRQLITGLISFIAAPAIVRASSLMPVHNLYYERIIAYYHIHTDEVSIRVDRAQFPLRVPPNYMLAIAKDVFYKEFPNAKAIIESIKPAKGEQFAVDFPVQYGSEIYRKATGWPLRITHDTRANS